MFPFDNSCLETVSEFALLFKTSCNAEAVVFRLITTRMSTLYKFDYIRSDDCNVLIL